MHWLSTGRLPLSTVYWKILITASRVTICFGYFPNFPIENIKEVACLGYEYFWDSCTLIAVWIRTTPHCINWLIRRYVSSHNPKWYSFNFYHTDAWAVGSQPKWASETWVFSSLEVNQQVIDKSTKVRYVLHFGLKFVATIFDNGHIFAFFSLFPQFSNSPQSCDSMLCPVSNQMHLISTCVTKTSCSPFY